MVHQLDGLLLTTSMESMVHGSYPKFGTRCRQELNASCGQEGCSKLWITSGAQDRQQCSSLGPWGLGPMGFSSFLGG